MESVIDMRSRVFVDKRGSLFISESLSLKVSVV